MNQSASRLKAVFPLQAIKTLTVAMGLVSVAAWLRVSLLGVSNTELIWLTFYPSVIVSVFLLGMHAGLLATAGACLTVWVIWPLLFKTILIESYSDITELLLFMLICSFICHLINALSRSRAALQDAQNDYSASAKREQFISSIINYMPNMIGYWDADLHCRFANNAFTKWYHKKPQEIIEMSFRELTGEQLFAINEPHIRAVLAGKPQRFERVLKKTDGSQGNIIGDYIPDFDANGKVKGFAIQSSEVTELKKTEEQLKMAAYVFESTADGIAVTDTNGYLLSINPAFEEITGYCAEEVLGQPSDMFRTRQNSRKFYLQIHRQIMAKGRWQYDMWSRRKDGEAFLAHFTVSVVRNDDGEPAFYVSVFNDITDRWNKDKHLKHLAFYDPLTDLPNRTLMMERLEQKIIHAKRTPCQLALMFIDLDNFKLVNDQLGHDVGDQLLKITAKRLLDLVRESDTVARLGGDEFIFILNNPHSKEQAYEVANRILNSINDPVEIRGMAIEIAMSVGVAMYPSDATSADQLIKHADTAMYKAKSLGENNIYFFADV